MNTSKTQLAILGGPRIRTYPITSEQPQISKTDIKNVTETLRKRKLSIFSNPNIKAFENNFAKFVGTKYAVALTSGTAALQAALCAMGVQPGDEILVPVYTYVATVNAILLQGAIPVFLDVRRDTFNLDHEDLSELKSKVTSRTKALVLVDLFGNPVPRAKLLRILRPLNITLIEDCAQSTGGFVGSQRVGSFGIGCHSFGEIKNMTSAEGGMVTTNNPELARKLRLLRHAGEVWKKTHNTTIGSGPNSLFEMVDGIDYEAVGFNFRMNALQAALGISQLSRLDRFNQERRKIADIYINGLGDLRELYLPAVPKNITSTYNRFPILLSETFSISRNAFLAALIYEGVPAGVYYPKPLNKSFVFRHHIGLGGGRFPFDPGNKNYRYADQLYPNAEWVCKRQILLPVYPGLSKREAFDVVRAVRKIITCLKNPSVVKRVEIQSKDTRASYFGQFFCVK